MADVEYTTSALTEFDLFGRRKIYTAAEEITRDNVITEVNEALSFHMMNTRTANS